MREKREDENGKHEQMAKEVDDKKIGQKQMQEGEEGEASEEERLLSKNFIQ